MPAAYKTPGVYIVEKNAFPNSIVEVATAVPAFIGYTEKAMNGGRSLTKKPWRISSMSEFVTYFGDRPKSQFTIAPVAATDPTAEFAAGGQSYTLNQTGGRYLLYYSMLQFFQNGGGPCYIVSVGDYSATPSPDDLKAGISALEQEQEPTMVLIPDAVLLAKANPTDLKDKMSPCIDVQQQMLQHCGLVMRNRIAILDIFDGDKPRQDPDGDPVEAFRDSLGINNLDYGAAYYPWLHTTIVQDRDLGYQNIANVALLVTALKAGLDPADPRLEDKTAIIDALSTPPDANGLITVGAGATAKQITVAQANQSLTAISPGVFGPMLSAAAQKLNLLPPAAAMAGLYTMVDNTRGVWKAPANVSVNGVIAPTVSLSNLDQEDLNVTPMGKSINAIRSFIGEGVLVWGARTLDGNSLDWRYINVRRTMIMLEESCKLAAKAMVFEPNVAGTWLTIKSMIENFLTSVWKRGGLAGAVPEDAFSVHVGLGDTMTANDILEGYLRVTVLVAISHPAEFIEITFQQQMQKS